MKTLRVILISVIIILLIVVIVITIGGAMFRRQVEKEIRQLFAIMSKEIGEGRWESNPPGMIITPNWV